MFLTCRNNNFKSISTTTIKHEMISTSDAQRLSDANNEVRNLLNSFAVIQCFSTTCCFSLQRMGHGIQPWSPRSQAIS